MGNIVSVSRDGKQKKAYTYDALNRIISEKDIDKEQEICYTYDNNGNILTKSVNGVVTSYAYEEGTDRLTSYGAETIGYDGMGNPKSYRGSELTWEKGRRLTSIEDETGEVTFGYDVFGQRNKKTAGGETTNYVYENGKLLRQITGSEVMTFIYGSEGIIGFKLGTSKYLYRKNVFGDVEEIYNEGGTLVGKYSYTAFGECEIETDENGIATKNPIRYRGYYFDEETGFYYLKTRYYDPETGRFITIDDISYLAPDTINGLNLYAYCGNNPVMRVDENGNAWWDWLIGTLTTALGIVLCFIPGGQVFGVGLIVAGASTLVSAGLETAGVNGKISSIITSSLSILAGIALCFTPFAGIGAGLIGQGIGGLAGGFISESLGGDFSTGAAIGGFIGGIVGGAVYRGYTNYRLSKMTPYQKGVMGEKYVQALYGNKAYKPTTGTNRPDLIFRDQSTLIEVKNVATQGLTNQLRRYLNMGISRNIIYVRLGTKVSQALKASGFIIKYFPW